MSLEEIRTSIRLAEWECSSKEELYVKVEDLVLLDNSLLNKENELRQCQEELKNLKKALKAEKDKNLLVEIQKTKEHKRLCDFIA